ncbi:MAG: DUF4062 domain-containing protein [Desulfomonilaceae bacterium]
MSKPRVFISSTYYDLKHLRSSLENFVESLGFEPILSEKGHITYLPDISVDESCYREARNADIFVLIIGGRYGSEASSSEKKPDDQFCQRYNSVTMLEYKSAVSSAVPCYILIEGNFYSEYFTFRKNRGNKQFSYAHVDSPNVFHLIDDILAQRVNNPVFAFQGYSEVEGWLKEQWAGLFKQLLGQLSQQRQLATLESKITELGEINQTLRKYLEAIILQQSPAEAPSLIAAEGKRLQEAQIDAQLRVNAFIRYLEGLSPGATFDKAKHVILESKSAKDLLNRLSRDPDYSHAVRDVVITLTVQAARRSLNEARRILGRDPFEDIDEQITNILESPFGSEGTFSE